jgi:hypothetical protein
LRPIYSINKCKPTGVVLKLCCLVTINGKNMDETLNEREAVRVGCCFWRAAV